MCQAVSPFWCNGKEKFKTHALAKKIVDRMNQRHEGARLSAYRCRTCGEYHIGSDAMKRPQRERTVW